MSDKYCVGMTPNVRIIIDIEVSFESKCKNSEITIVMIISDI